MENQTNPTTDNPLDEASLLSIVNCQLSILKGYFPNLTDTQQAQLDALYPLYADWNAKINVISRKDIGNLYLHHVLHSLGIMQMLRFTDGSTVMDVGTGGGFPGIPLAILLPEVQFHLVDSIGKKIKVVREVASALGLTNVRAEHCRVEQLDGGKSRFDWVVSRAVTDLKTFVGWTWGRTTYGILYLKGGDLEAEIAEAGRHTEQLPVSTWFDGEFFETKKVLVLPKK